MTSSRTLLAGAALLLLAGCSHQVEEEMGAARSAHAVGEIIPAGGSPFHWANVPETSLSSPPATTPVGDPLRTRLQAWADRVDALVQADARARGARHVPTRPVVHLVPSSSVNAWNAGAFLSPGFSFGGAPGFTLLSTQRVMPLTGGLDGVTIATAPLAWPSSAQALADVWRTSDPACELAASGPKELRTVGCPAEGHGSALLVAATPHVYLNSGLVEGLDEKATVAVLAHELGHYYRAHASSLTASRYGFWYESSDASHRPVPSARQGELAARYERVLSAPQGKAATSRLYHDRMVTLIAKATLWLASEPAAVRECGPELTTAARSRWLVGFLIADAGDRDLRAFQRLEGTLHACADKLTLGESSTERAVLRRGLSELLVEGGFARVHGELDAAATVAAGLAKARDAAARMDAEERAMLDALRAGKVGLYTAEEEADDVMLEITSRLGMTTDDVLEGWLGFMRHAESKGFHGRDDATGELGADACEALLREDFQERTAAGQRRPVVMTLGALSDPHHGFCYRLYNLWREQRTHGYRPSGAFTAPTGGDWATLRAHAAGLSRSAGAP